MKVLKQIYIFIFKIEKMQKLPKRVLMVTRLTNWWLKFWIIMGIVILMNLNKKQYTKMNSQKNILCLLFKNISGLMINNFWVNYGISHPIINMFLFCPFNYESFQLSH